MSENKVTRDELLILLRDTYHDLNNLLNILRDVFFANLDDVADALIRKKTTTQNNNPDPQ